MPEDKRRRRDVLEELVRSGRFRTQEDLADELTRRGLPATAATVSRDLKALGYVKSVGGGAYTLPPTALSAEPSAPVPNSGSEALLRRLLVDLPLEVDQAGYLMVLKTLPGSAHTLAAPLDACRWPEVVGTVAGDDTIFIALRDPSLGETFRQRLHQLRTAGRLTALG